MEEKIRKLHGNLENLIKFNDYLNYTHLAVENLTGLRLSGQLVNYRSNLPHNLYVLVYPGSRENPD